MSTENEVRIYKRAVRLKVGPDYSWSYSNCGEPPHLKKTLDIGITGLALNEI